MAGATRLLWCERAKSPRVPPTLSLPFRTRNLACVVRTDPGFLKDPNGNSGANAFQVSVMGLDASNGGLAWMRDPVKPGSAVDAYGLAVSTLMAVIAEWAVVPPWLKKQPVTSCAELVR